MGAKLDGWSEYFNFDIWTSAFEKCEVNGDFYAYRQKDYDEILPWDFIDVGVNKEYLIRENERAKLSQVTPDCRLGCENCGVNINLDGECFNGSVFNKIQQGQQYKIYWPFGSYENNTENDEKIKTSSGVFQGLSLIHI